MNVAVSGQKRKGTGLGKGGKQREDLQQKVLEIWTCLPAIDKMKEKRPFLTFLKLRIFLN